MACLLLIGTWHLLFEAAPVFQRLARNAGSDEPETKIGMARCSVPASNAAQIGLPLLTGIAKTRSCFCKP
jgi:hypothetical protein